MSRVAYCAQPIDFIGNGKQVRYVEQIKDAMRARGWVIYCPAQAFSVSYDTIPGPEIERVNQSVLRDAGLVVAFLPKGVPSVGVPSEIQMATSLGIPTAVLGAAGSWYLAGGSANVFDKYDELIRWLPNAGVPTPEPAIEFRVGSGGILPTRAHAGDAGWDLYSDRDVYVEPGEFVDVATNVRVALPPGTWANIVGRSSTWRRWKLNVIPGVIDGGYRGWLFSAVHNPTADVIRVPYGTRLTQLILHQNVTSGYTARAVTRDQFDQIPAVDRRGSDGFGSTGAGVDRTLASSSLDQPLF